MVIDWGGGGSKAEPGAHRPINVGEPLKFTTLDLMTQGSQRSYSHTNDEAGPGSSPSP